MRVSGEQLKRLPAAERFVPAPIQPRLTLSEELALLTVRTSHRTERYSFAIVREAYGEAQTKHAAIESLRCAGLLRRAKGRGYEPSPPARVGDRLARLTVVIRRPAPPTRADLELLLLLAASDALELARSDRLRLRHQISASTASGSPVARRLCAKADVESMTQLAELLLPHQHDTEIGTFDPGVTPGVWGGSFGAQC